MMFYIPHPLQAVNSYLMSSSFYRYCCYFLYYSFAVAIIYYYDQMSALRMRNSRITASLSKLSAELAWFSCFPLWNSFSIISCISRFALKYFDFALLDPFSIVLAFFNLFNLFKLFNRMHVIGYFQLTLNAKSVFLFRFSLHAE